MSSPPANSSDPNCPKNRAFGRGPYGPDVERSIAAARKFYAADSKLSTEDRKELHQSFWRSWAVRPLGGLAMAYLGIMTPIWLKKAGRINPKKNTRFSQVFMGLGGLFFGQGVMAAIGYNYYYYKFSQRNMNQATCWGMMGLVPSRLPSRYYELTAKDPRYIMKDPDTIDWNTEVMFPLNLVAHRDSNSNIIVYGDRRAGEFRPASSTYGQLPTQPGAATTQRDAFLDPQQPQQSQQPAPPQYHQPQRGGSSWDRVRSGKPAADQPVADQGWLPPPLPDSTNNQGWAPPSPPANEPKNELEKEQAKFDEMVEKARAGDGVGDDFTETERKWR